MTEPDIEAIRSDLALIRRMVDQSRQVRAETGHVYLVIGVLFLIASLVDALLPPSIGWIGWPVAGVGGWGFAVVVGRKLALGRGHIGYAPPIEGVAWTAAFVVICIYTGLSFAIEGGPPRLLFPLIALFVSIPLAVSGALYRYWPLLAGAGVFLIDGVITAFVGDVGQRLGFSVAMLLGYVLPGIGMTRQARSRR